MKIAVTGASGFVGRRLCEAARARGHEVVAIQRRPDGFDPVEGADAVVHLAGEPVAE